MQLSQFCDMEQLYRLLDNWSKSCGMNGHIAKPINVRELMQELAKALG